MQGTISIGTILAVTESRKFIYERYNVIPLNLERKCDGCLQTFSVSHTLSFRNVGLAIACHKEIWDNKDGHYPLSIIL